MDLTNNMPRSGRKCTSDVWTVVKRLRVRGVSERGNDLAAAGFTHVCVHKLPDGCFCNKPLNLSRAEKQNNVWIASRHIQKEHPGLTR
jgi:hypothetical protein